MCAGLDTGQRLRSVVGSGNQASGRSWERGMPAQWASKLGCWREHDAARAGVSTRGILPANLLALTDRIEPMFCVTQQIPRTTAETVPSPLRRHVSKARARARARARAQSPNRPNPQPRFHAPIGAVRTSPSLLALSSPQCTTRKAESRGGVLRWRRRERDSSALSLSLRASARGRLAARPRWPLTASVGAPAPMGPCPGSLSGSTMRADFL